MTNKELTRKTLEWVNELRGRVGGLPPLRALPKGTPASAERCPVAQALMGVFDTLCSTTHTGTCWYPDKKAKAPTFRIKHPEFVTLWIRNYDVGRIKL